MPPSIHHLLPVSPLRAAAPPLLKRQFRTRPNVRPQKTDDAPKFASKQPEKSSTGRSDSAYRWETIAPSTEQLSLADNFFLRYPPKHLWSEAKFKQIDFGSVPEVTFLGRSNVGKSSLLNSLLNNKSMAYTSSKPGRTRLMNAYSVHSGKLLLLDMPGYGHASQADWGIQVMKYLMGRKQFRRAFVLIDAMHGPKQSDMLLLENLGRAGVSYQIVLSKIDRLNQKDDSLNRTFKDTRELMETAIPGPRGLGEVLGTAADPAKGPKAGISALRWSILAACGLQNLG